MPTESQARAAAPRGERRLLVAPDAATRIDAAVRWLEAHGPTAEVLVLAESQQAADELVRQATPTGGARFGVQRMTLRRLAALLAVPALATEGRAPASELSLTALAARATHLALARGGLPYLRRVADRPGFATALARSLGELRTAGIEPEALRPLGRAGQDLAELAEAAQHELDALAVADRAWVLAAATALASCDAPAPPVGLPLLLLDAPLATAAEVELVEALARRAPAVLATAPDGDTPGITRLERALGCAAERSATPKAGGSLGRLQQHLFEETVPEPAPLDETVTLRGWPGVARECVEIARQIQAEAARGVPFDRIAVFLHAASDYAVQLEEALQRAAVPAYFARGTTRPHPAGRALLALLACAAEKLSARRFAEYLSLAQVPDPEAPNGGTFVAPSDEMLRLDAGRVEEDVVVPDDEHLDPTALDADAAARRTGTVRAPWRWEQLLVDAAVIGSKERWERRLDGLAREIEQQRAGLEPADEGRIAACERRLEDLAHLRAFALPLIERLAALPETASWGEWLVHLRDLVRVAVRDPEPVLAVLGELEPIAPVGPVGLDELRFVLTPRLRDLQVPPAPRRYGAVFVAPAGSARGLAFDVVFVPGLAERLFPRKIVEDPLLPDALREQLDGERLPTQATRVAQERLALRLSIGAARSRVHLSYPRVDVEQARARVPSFYLLEALRATEARLPGFDELALRTGGASPARLGWPAPEQPERAIDDAEYDLALLAPLVEVDERTAQGSAHYLLGTNPHLARALRARGRRWKPRWFPVDGLVDPDAHGRAALARHQLAARSFSPTALQHYAVCPYRFFLQALMRLAPREEPVAIETMDALTRGGLFHDVQYEILTELKARALLPVRPATLDEALAIADEALERVAAERREELAPAIPRVWDDAIAGMRADLHEWLRRAAHATDGFVPDRFELAFGIVDRERAYQDPASSKEPVALAGGLKLRGSIDLVERNAHGMLRVTDHKTGKPRAGAGLVIGGGTMLQPVLYALACEVRLDATVESGRLYYCTADGGYSEAIVPLDDRAREAAAMVIETIGGALAEGFLPAAPSEGACRWCDYRPVCGPYEEQRTRLKPKDRLAPLERLRGMP